MALPNYPNPISLYQVNIELGASGTSPISLNQTNVRTLFQKTSGIISMYDGYGKINALIAPSIVAVGQNLNIQFTITNPNGISVTAYYSTNGGGSFTPIAISASSSVIINKVVSYQTSMTMFAYSTAFGYANSGFSNSATATSYSRLGIPVFNSTLGGIKSVSYTWNAVANATNYVVTFNGSTTNQSTLTFNQSGLQSSSAYALSVVAQGSGYSDSDIASAFVFTWTKLSTPVFTSATAGEGSVSFIWNAVSNATSYDVVFNGNLTNQTGTSFTGYGLTGGQSYPISVYAKASGYETSDVASTSKVAGFVTLAAPTGLAATAATYSVTFTWNMIGGITYKGSVNSAPLATYTSPLTLTDSTGGVAYTLNLKATQSGYNDSSYVALSKTSLLPIPSQPTNLVFTSPNITTLVLSWSDGAIPATSWDVVIRDKNGNMLSQTTVYSRTISHTVNAGITRTFIVTPINNAGYGTLASAQTYITMPNVTFNSVTANPDRTITAVIAAIGGNPTYNYAIDNTTILSSTTSTTYTTPVQTAGSSHQIYVYATSVDGYNSPNWSISSSVTVPSLITYETINTVSRTTRATNSTTPYWYQFTPTTSGQYTFVLSSSAIDAYIEVYEVDGITLLGQNDDDGYLNNSQLTLSLTAAVAYKIKARAYNNISSGAHEISIYGGSCSVITTTGDYISSINVAGANVTYRFTPTTTKSFTFLLGGTLGDTYMLLYDNTGYVLTQDDDSGGSSRARFSHSCTAGMDYYVKCMHYNSGTGSFTLTIT
jgi:hypothetical protein